ncbi:hypothetical protein [Exiguobacterium sp. s130]|uniref:hypothetical protein n=1 Tax=Exiguobacterium sp. s130 TaxID=2751190 RepID=UPI001BE6480E|nr:hypothetical protein [Exiguobacterium sp. s130]
MPFVLSVKDTYRQAVEAASGGRNTVMYDDKGNPSIMVFIPRFNLADVIDGAPASPHPAFIVNGVVKDGIWISKYQNVIHDGRAYSLPGMNPATNLTIDAASTACKAKGTGWHLMTNSEWAAIALWCKKNGSMPRGNNNYGKDVTAPHETARLITPSTPDKVLTGTGPISWSHDNTTAGIYDLNGNIHEFVDGLRLINGKIWVHKDNDFGTDPNSMAAWVDTGVFIDNTLPGNADTSASKAPGTMQFSNERLNPMSTLGDSDVQYAYNTLTFETMGSKSGYTVPDLLKYLAIAPTAGSHGGDALEARNYGSRIAFRGGKWNNMSLGGVYLLNLYPPRSLVSSDLGFRASFIV